MLLRRCLFHMLLFTRATPATCFTTHRLATLITPVVANSTQYDFIIIGGGTSGLTVAARLTENPEVRVLVIEAGPLDKNETFVRVPGLYNPFPYLWPSIDSVPQTALDGISYDVPVARVVGGGSVVNGLIWTRSAKSEYDDWENLGGTGWGWNDMFPYFQKSETFTPPNADFAKRANISWSDDVHGFSGPISVSYPNFFYPVSGNWWDAALSTGLRPSSDLNSGNPSGVSFLALSVEPGLRMRSDARISYFSELAGKRSNYHLLADNTVSRILFNGNRAVGVEYTTTSQDHIKTAVASKEVLIAAGGIHTPQVLQLSGIGPKALLQKLGIKVLVDLPGVGSNFQDTPNFAIPYHFPSGLFPTETTFATNSSYQALQSRTYNSSREGPYVIPGGESTNLGMLPLCNITSKCYGLVLDAQMSDPLVSLPGDISPTVSAGYVAQRQQRLRRLLGQDIVSAYMTWNTGDTVTLFLGTSLSRGSVVINSTNIFQNPVIDWRSMTDPLDFEIIQALFNRNREIMRAPSMLELKPVEASPFGNNKTDPAEILQALRQVANPSLAHPCCTAPMMYREYGGVVDANKKVYGTQGLRVIDISTFPVLTTLPPQAAVYASAEKIADIIKKAWNI